MTGYRLLDATPHAASIAAERTGDYHADGGAGPDDVRVDVVAEAARGISDLADLLGPIDVYAGLDAAELRTHLHDLKVLSGLAIASFAKATLAYGRAGGIKEDGGTGTRSHFRNQGMSNHEAEKMAALAAGLDEAPDTAAALASGELSPDGAKAITDAMRGGRLGNDPKEVEQELLAMGRGSTPEKLRRHIKKQEQRRDGARLLRDEKRQHQLRRLTLTEQSDGMWSLHGSLPAEAGEKAKTLLDSLMTWDPADTPANKKRTTVQRTADALIDAVDWMLDHRDLPTAAGRSRPHMTVVVDGETVAADMTDPDTGQAVPPDHHRWADLPTGTFSWSDRPLSPQAVRRICCDAGMTRVITNADGMPLDVGRETRTWSGSQRTAITVRDGQCRGPGCDRPVGWTEIHHVTWWRNGGPTDLDNGLLLCRACHRLIHDTGWTVHLEPATAAATWTSPTGVRTVTIPHGRPTNRARPPDRTG